MTNVNSVINGMAAIKITEEAEAQVTLQPKKRNIFTAPSSYDAPKADNVDHGVSDSSSVGPQTITEEASGQQLPFTKTQGVPEEPASGKDGEGEPTPLLPKFYVTESISMASQWGTIDILLRAGIMVQISVDQAIRVYNCQTNVILVCSASGGNSGMLHPAGRMWQHGRNVEMLVHDPYRRYGHNKYAKMGQKLPILFTSDETAVVYALDAAGTRTTSAAFGDLFFEFSYRIFCEESHYGPCFIDECLHMLDSGQYEQTANGGEIWQVNGVTIVQDFYGNVEITREGGKYRICTSTLFNSTATITTPFVHCTASRGLLPHMFVRSGNRRMHFDGNKFTLRYAGRSSGLNSMSELFL